MPERYKPDLGSRSPMPESGPGAGHEDPLVELARIVSGPSGFDTGRASAPGSAGGLDADLEAELMGAGEGIDPIGPDFDWPAPLPEPEPLPGSKLSSEGFDDFPHLNLRRSSRGEGRRVPARNVPAPPQVPGWDPIEMEAGAAPSEGRDILIPGAEPALLPASAPMQPPFDDGPPILEGAMASAADGPDADFSLGRYGEEGFDAAAEPEYDEAAEDEEPRSGGIRKGMLLAGAAAAVLVLGGFGAIAYISKDSGKTGGAPQVIAADNNPVKVAPPTPAQDANAAANNKLIYDRVDDPSKDALKTTAAPITTPPQPSGQASAGSQAISRIAADSGQGGGGAGATFGTGGPGGGTPDSSDANVPTKRVRTVAVTPDGTIISSRTATNGVLAPLPDTGSVGAGAPAAAVGTPAPAAGGAGPAPRPNPRTAADNAAAGAVPTGATANAATTATGAGAAATTPPANGAAGSTISQGNGTTVATRTVTTTTTRPATGNTGATAGAPAQGAGGPVSLLPQGNANAPAQGAQTRTASTGPAAGAVTPGADGWVVQVTSQKSESAAQTAYRDLQKRFPNLLSDKPPDMQRADLGTRGVFYRVRVGPVGTQEAANSFCDSLKTAGADCVVVRN